MCVCVCVCVCVVCVSAHGDTDCKVLDLLTHTCTINCTNCPNNSAFKVSCCDCSSALNHVSKVHWNGRFSRAPIIN